MADTFLCVTFTNTHTYTILDTNTDAQTRTCSYTSHIHRHIQMDTETHTMYSHTIQRRHTHTQIHTHIHTHTPLGQGSGAGFGAPRPGVHSPSLSAGGAGLLRAPWGLLPGCWGVSGSGCRCWAGSEARAGTSSRGGSWALGACGPRWGQSCPGHRGRGNMAAGLHLCPGTVGVSPGP